MKDLKDTCRVAVVQCAPVMFDKKAGTEKMVELIREAGKNGAELIVFPELIIPCYPYGMTFGYTVGSRDKVGRLDWKRYYDNSLCVPGPETELLGQAAKEVHAYVSIGVSERGEDSATLYNSNLVFSPPANCKMRGMCAIIEKKREGNGGRFTWNRNGRESDSCPLRRWARTARASPAAKHTSRFPAERRRRAWCCSKTKTKRSR